jgi:hypothetical protein
MALAPAGYSGKALWQKLGLKAMHRLYVAGAPPHLPHLLEGAPKVALLPRLAEFDVALLFITSRSALAAELARALPKLADRGMIWVAWPKKASGVGTDVTEDTVREIAAAGLVDVKVCAMTRRGRDSSAAPAKMTLRSRSI